MNLPKWRITKVPNGRYSWALQVLRTDASKPYYLTQKFYAVEVIAKRALKEVLETGQIPKV